ncbi:Smr/MutS family protein [Modicisalibacter sp. 'Wilcox']|uniref:Smr/MutS family protein n=1 Tax=Modicisalibacter sp. 'Wilcox' TaxID=2679914 RepID=UPI0013D8D7D1|nr:Smr/MutS family protein [Modicisalibacter sp. 'Wilcox']
MSRRRGTPDEEVSLFRQALQEAGVQRLFSDRADPGTPRRDDPQRLAARRDAAVSAATDAGHSRTSDGRVEPLRPSTPLDFAVPDLPYRTHSALKRGRIAWEAGLDLHGYTLEEARAQLEQFLHDARHQRQRCVLVVHGKAWTGMADYPVIKSHVNAWLREWPSVLAFCSATDADGGTGAAYVLLRRRGGE